LLSVVAVVEDLAELTLLEVVDRAAEAAGAGRGIRPFTTRARWRLRSQSRLAQAAQAAQLALARRAGFPVLARFFTAAAAVVVVAVLR
jgi:hypothetical protein